MFSEVNYSTFMDLMKKISYFTNLHVKFCIFIGFI
jgi:hypothetical protein